MVDRAARAAIGDVFGRAKNVAAFAAQARRVSASKKG